MGEDRIVAPGLCVLQFLSAMYAVLERRRAFRTAGSVGYTICVRGCRALGLGVSDIGRVGGVEWKDVVAGERDRVLASPA
jgi:hypothetical protein